MKKKVAKARRSKSPQKDMMEAYNASPWYSVGRIIPTSHKPKEDVFESFRPDRPCVDYKISETWAKMQKGDLKINVRETVATYEEIPPEICKPPKRKKKLCVCMRLQTKLFSGGPPQWKFIDEIWREHVSEVQTKCKTEHKRVSRDIQVKSTSKRKNAHDMVQRLVGPEWFMELSPKQLAGIDQLQKAVLFDLHNRTTINCEEILAILGLVLRPNKRHIWTALEHSCGDPVEFLLVLYQLIDPKRESYSLNDRLLLSSVVHLSIRSTLRELHVRIPSPPRIPIETRVESKRDKKKKYSSPYLEPLTYQPPPPRFSGIYKNKHKQYPESPYFSYMESFEKEKKFNQFILPCAIYRENDELKKRMQEYGAAQEFFESLPGVKQEMLRLIFPSVQTLCPNMLHPAEPPPIKENLIPPHLCKVAISEPVLCFCEENCLQGKSPHHRSQKKIKRSTCEKAVQDKLNSLCLCDDCLENVRQKNLIRIHGGFQRTPCKCDDPVPIIQGTLQNKVCECYKKYRNKIVACAARQRMTEQTLKFVVGGVSMTRYGPVYNILGCPGEKICLCKEIKERKAQLKKCKEIIVNNEAKFVNGGINMTIFGPVYALNAVVARKPCKCILRYRQQLEVLAVQNEVRKNPTTFINHGLIFGKLGPIFHLSNVPSGAATKRESDLHEVCSCVIKKTKCFEQCMDYLEYKVATHEAESCSSEESDCISGDSDDSDTDEESGSTSSSSCSSSESDDEANGSGGTCPYCSAKMKNNRREMAINGAVKSSCKKSVRPKPSSSESSSDESETTSENSSETSSASSSDVETSPAPSGSGDDDFFKPKPCKCKQELDRFMKSKCPCEACNRIIRRGYATYVMGGKKMTPSGGQVNIVQGVQQRLCSCMHNHLENIRQIDEYKSRIKARYNLRKQPKKYCISGVKNTPDGPIYIISGIRPPVECECGKAMREKEETEAFEKQRAKPPNSGRIKYEISGVRAMPDENIYILSRALKVTPCECEKLLRKFERAHKGCMEEFEKFLKLTKEETEALADNVGYSLHLRSVDITYAEAFDRFPSDSNLKSARASADKEASQNKPTDNEDVTNQPSEDATSTHSKEERMENENKQDDVAEANSEANSQNKNKKVPVCCPSQDENDTTSSAKTNSTSTSSTSSSSDDKSTVSSEASAESGDDDGSEYGSCHVDNPPEVKPIEILRDKELPESFLSMRFAIFRNMPKCKKKLMKIVKHILEGMAVDGFPLAKLPHVHKLPIFKLWVEMRIGTYWTYEDKLTYLGKSKYYWKHTDLCYKNPEPGTMPFTLEQARTMSWKHAKYIRKVAAEKMEEYYRKVKQTTVDTGREFFATTFPYEFPTYTWRDCAFAYLPTKEEDVFPYKIVQPHEARFIPENRRLNCYC